MFKTFQKIIFVLLLVTILAGPMISWAVLSWINLENPKIMETLDIDLNEKRNKATLSEPINMSTIIYCKTINNFYFRIKTPRNAQSVPRHLIFVAKKHRTELLITLKNPSKNTVNHSSSFILL